MMQNQPHSNQTSSEFLKRWGLIVFVVASIVSTIGASIDVELGFSKLATILSLLFGVISVFAAVWSSIKHIFTAKNVVLALLGWLLITSLALNVLTLSRLGKSAAQHPDSTPFASSSAISTSTPLASPHAVYTDFCNLIRQGPLQQIYYTLLTPEERDRISVDSFHNTFGASAYCSTPLNTLTSSVGTLDIYSVYKNCYTFTFTLKQVSTGWLISSWVQNPTGTCTS